MKRTGQRIQRPLTTTLRRKRPNEVKHIDFFHTVNTKKGDRKYVLILKDDLTSYSWLQLYSFADNEAAAKSLVKWIPSYGSLAYWSPLENHLLQYHYSDNSPKNLSQTSIHQDYCSWANGSVEYFCKEVFQAFSVILSECKLLHCDWPAMCDCVQGMINDLPSERLGGRNGYRTS